MWGHLIYIIKKILKIVLVGIPMGIMLIIAVLIAMIWGLGKALIGWSMEDNKV